MIEEKNFFYARNQTIIKNLSDLKLALEEMDQDTFNHHVTEDRNDFASWISGVIADKKLAKEFTNSRNKQDMIKALDKKLKKTEAKEKIVGGVEKDIEEMIEKKVGKPPKKDTVVDIQLEKIGEIIKREKEIEKKEEILLKTEEELEKQLSEIKSSSGNKFFTKEFTQGLIVGALIAVILFLVYIKFLS